MLMPLWIGFQPSDSLKCWYCKNDQDWVQLGAMLSSENWITPMVFAVHQSQLELSRVPAVLKKSLVEFGFVLKRDDSSLLPVYEQNTPASKVMSMFGEYVGAMSEFAASMNLNILQVDLSEKPGGFRVQAQFPGCTTIGEVARILGLFRGGLEILSYTRGFQMSGLAWNGIAVDKNLLSNLRELLC